jgi:UDP-N-acetylmuramoyl-tripeptide--D-alanyl-D-alanine ligase
VHTALQALAREHRRRIGVPVVAITGSSGKTTTKDVVSRVLSRHLRIASSAGNLNSQLGLPLCLLNDLGPEHELAVYEVGMSARGEIARLAGMIEPTIGAVTNIGPAHLEFLGSLDGVYEAKAELIDALPSDGRLVLNAQDVYAGRMRARFPGRTIMVSLGELSAASAEVIELEIQSSDLEGTRGRLRVGDESHDFCFPLLGRHLACSGLMAVAIGRELGLPVGALIEALAGCEPAKHRMEVRRGRVLVLDDCYNANPSSTRAALAFLAEVPYAGRKIAVLGDMLELGETGPESHRAVLAGLAETGFSRAILVGPLFAAAAAQVDGGERFLLAPDASAAAGIIAREVRPGDLVLLKGSRGIKLEELLAVLA